MKKCTYCGKEYGDEATLCTVDNEPLQIISPAVGQLNVSENPKVKRPASHRWVIVISAFMTVGFVIFVLDLISGRSGAKPAQYTSLIVFFSLFALALFCLLFGGRQKWAYYVTSVLLSSYALKAIYNSLFYAYYFLNGIPISRPVVHLAERDKALVVQQNISTAKQLLVFVTTCFLIWLCLRFIVGRPSRSYYRFIDAEKAPLKKEIA